MGELRNRVLKGIENIRPYLQADGGDINLVDITDENIVKVKLIGSCNDCPWSQDTLQLGVEQAIKKVAPEISKVINV